MNSRMGNKYMIYEHNLLGNISGQQQKVLVEALKLQTSTEFIFPTGIELEYNWTCTCAVE